jgi:uncharacterized protein (DUF1697 family)
MTDLRDLFMRAGFGDVRTLLQTGNVVFTSSAGGGSTNLEGRLEAEAAARLGLETDIHVRTAAEWAVIVDANPFTREAKSDPSHLVVMCLKAEPTGARVKALRTAIAGRERVEVSGRHAYAVYPDGIGTSRLTAAVIDRALGTRCTARNWNTVVKLAALAGVA